MRHFMNRSGRLHGLALGDAADVSHLGVEEQVLVVVGLVHEDPVDAELLEREHVVLVGLVSELGESHVQALLRDLHLLHAEPFAVLRLDLGYAVGELGDLALYERLADAPPIRVSSRTGCAP